MYKPSSGIAPEGLPSIGLGALTSVVFAALDCGFLAVIFLAFTAFACYFFRDPERVVPVKPDVAVSPADGKVIKVTKVQDPFTKEERQCICIFMNLFSVHVNRMPVTASITEIAYHQGTFINAAYDKASTDNERCAYALRDTDGNHWTMVQIAGLVARRIVCGVAQGESLARGERFGMIKFGSRVDVYVPEGYTPAVFVGQNVSAGSSIIAHKISHDA